jgi:hypothetical protein
MSLLFSLKFTEGHLIDRPSNDICCYPIFDPCFDKFSKKSKNSENIENKKYICFFNIFASFLAFSTSSQKNLNFQRSLERVDF